MIRNYTEEANKRIAFIRKTLNNAGATGVVYGNSGGKDSALVGILCKMACENTVGLIMPCGSRRNYNEDKTDAQEVARQFNISTRIVDLSDLKQQYVDILGEQTQLTELAAKNLAAKSVT